MASGDIKNAHVLSSQLADALGNESRIRALNAGNKGANFSNTRFVNTLHNFKPQVGMARLLNNSAGMSMSDQQAINNALLDAVETYRSSQPVKTPVHDAMVTLSGKGVGTVVGGLIGGVLGSPTIGALAGQHVVGKFADALNRGVLDEFMGTNKAAKDFIQYMSDPVNAKAIQDVIESRASRGVSTDDSDLQRIVRNMYTATGNTLHNMNYNTVQPTYTPQVQVQPEQRKQPPNEPTPSIASEQTVNFDNRTTKLYKALSHAETGNLDNRFIRTRSIPKNDISTAYGPAQLTVDTAKRFYKSHSKLFNEQETRYLHSFFDQGERMKNASNNDPVYGYGGTGVLNSKEDRKLYARVVRKMLQQMVKENGGSLDKTVQQWRGNKNDHAYFAKVRTAYRNS